VTMHDAGTILNPALLDGQVRGGFAHAVGAASCEQFAYGEDGSFLSGTFADYLVPTACEVPEPVILHMSTPSPVTPLGAKGVGEGNCMSTPVCIANAVADALGKRDICLPLSPPRLAALIASDETPAKRGAAPATLLAKAGKGLTGQGETTVPAPPEAVWRLLLDPRALRAMLPGCHELEVTGENAYRVDITVGVGPVRGRYEARLRLSDLEAPRSLRLLGEGLGALGTARGDGTVELAATADGGTTLRYRYQVEIGGKVAAVGARMLQGATRILIDQFFERLIVQVNPDAARSPYWRRLLRLLGIGR